MTDFDHFLLTRFNARQGPARAGDGWLRHRLELFEDLCLPSVRAQSSDSFRWLVFFDSERDQWFQREVDRLSEGAFEPIWVDGALTTDLISDEVQGRSSSPWLITTRVDNDDAVAKDFIERIQHEFARQDFEFINFNSGLQLAEDGAVFRWTDLSGPFISLIEKRSVDGAPRTVHIDGHDKLTNYGNIRGLDPHPMWLQMIHGKNLANEVRGIRTSPRQLLEHFVVHRTATPISMVSLRTAQLRNIVKLVARVLRHPRFMRRAVSILRSRILGQWRE
ncbi:putative rhamnosyl transferase [Arthrobacter bambusae]|uniref:glycosyltransferase n=1 Tax=Arthrobacter TaxID=1663 RepID=UPI001F507709|nr:MULTISPECIES: glycosyltransferase [Arthrobacter]MCI0139987.1 putative rhamnosyl transferase [Arthrobacter bambusae]